MTFTPDFFLEDFENALTEEWQKTGEIAVKVGCSRKTATQKLEELLERKQEIFKEHNVPVDIEMSWVSGGRKGTRAWRFIPKNEVEIKGRQYGKALQLYSEFKQKCNFRLQEIGCTSRENSTMLCTYKDCPKIIRR